jgi:hypothetical protein
VLSWLDLKQCDAMMPSTIRMLSLTVNEILFAKDGTRQKEITSIAQGAKGVDGWVVGAGTCYNRLGI